MGFRVGIVIGASLLLVTVQPNPSSHACTRFTELSEPCGCTLSHETFDPICGSDGHTYLSECFLECRKAIDEVDISIDYTGVCSKESRCTCHAGYAPICGSNGVTYSNECVFDCFKKKDHRIQLKHQGECGSVAHLALPDKSHYKDTPGTCPCHPKLRSYNTRFGNKGQRYARCGCRPKKEKLAAQTTHTVQTVRPATEPDPFPLCDSQKKNVNPRQPEDVKEQENTVDSKKCVCAAMHKPVCGNNQRSYANFCVLYCSSKKDPGIKFRHWGLVTRNKKRLDDTQIEDTTQSETPIGNRDSLL